MRVLEFPGDFELNDDGEWVPRSVPCRCWVTSPPLPHTGHCCFGDDPRDVRDMTPGVTHCGHWHPDVPKPTVQETL